jgi:hypothetical protein
VGGRLELKNRKRRPEWGTGSGSSCCRARRR